MRDKGTLYIPPVPTVVVSTTELSQFQLGKVKGTFKAETVT